MLEFITDFFHNIFGNNVILATIVIAIIPLIELKGAIPFAMSVNMWGEHALNSVDAFLYAFLGSIIVVPILALIFKPIYNYIKDKKFFKSIVNFLVGDIKKKSENTDEKTKEKSERKKFWLKVLTVVLFVAFPVPLTGVWTGTCLAVLMGLNFWQTCTTVILGNAICGVIVAFVCAIFPSATNIILYVFLGLILVALIVKLIMHIIAKKRSKENEVEAK